MGRITIEQVKDELEQEGWHLLSDKYHNLQTELHMECPNGHKVFIPFGQWRKTKKCPICAQAEKNIQKSGVVIAKPKGAKRLLALDQATISSGWAIYDNNVLTQYGLCKVDDNDTQIRINQVKQWLCNMINNWKPDYIALEDIQLQSFGVAKGASKYSTDGITTFKVLAQLQGVVINTCIEHNIEYQVVHSAQWRAWCNVTGRSRSDKKRSAQLKVKEFYQVSATQDEADAICIGKYAAEKGIKENTLIRW